MMTMTATDNNLSIKNMLKILFTKVRILLVHIIEVIEKKIFIDDNYRGLFYF